MPFYSIISSDFTTITKPNGTVITLSEISNAKVSSSVSKTSSSTVKSSSNALIQNNTTENLAESLAKKLLQEEKELQEEKLLKFVDVGENSWYYSYINDAYNLGLVKGITESLFMPNNAIKRADTAVMIARMLGLDGTESTENFADVSDNKYYANEVGVLKEKGIINGYEDGNFKPEQDITREEAMVIISNILDIYGIEITGSNTNFIDFMEVSDYAKESVGKLAALGIIEGYDGKINPKEKITRAEFTKIILEVYELINE